MDMYEPAAVIGTGHVLVMRAALASGLRTKTPASFPCSFAWKKSLLKTKASRQALLSVVNSADEAGNEPRSTKWTTGPLPQSMRKIIIRS